MKRLKYIIPIFACIFGIILFIIYIESICSLDKCNNPRVRHGEYCSEHTCETKGCTNKKAPGSYTCYSCHDKLLNTQEEEDVILTDSQVAKIKKVIKKYTKNLMEKQSNILAVNLINDYPESVSKYSCSFRCNVVREDSDTNLATIYVSINSNETFKVNRLMYDE